MNRQEIQYEIKKNQIWNTKNDNLYVCILDVADGYVTYEYFYQLKNHIVELPIDDFIDRFYFVSKNCAI